MLRRFGVSKWVVRVGAAGVLLALGALATTAFAHGGGGHARGRSSYGGHSSYGRHVYRGGAHGHTAGSSYVPARYRRSSYDAYSVHARQYVVRQRTRATVARTYCR
jgi:hypothetical protein